MKNQPQTNRKPIEKLTTEKQIRIQQEIRKNELSETVQILKKEFVEFSKKHNFEDFISVFEEFCKEKGVTELEISRLKQRHSARLNPEKTEIIFNNWEAIVLILQSGFMSLLTLDSAKNNDFLSKNGTENFESKLREDLPKDIESTLKSMFYTYLWAFIGHNIRENNPSDEMYFYSILTSVILFILLNDQVIDRISAIKQTKKQENRIFEDLAGLIKN